MEKKEETRRMAVYVAPIKADYNYGSQVFEYSIVTVDAAGKVRNCSDTDPFSADFDDLIFRCQVSRAISDGKPFAYSCEYRGIHSLDLTRAERCLKMLRKVAKASDKFPVRPESFGQYVQMMARALGITALVQHPKDGGSGWHDETNYITWKAKDIQYVIDAQITAFLAEHGERIMATAI